MTAILQGALANQTGRTLESIVQSIFVQKGFTVLAYADFAAMQGSLLPLGDALVRRVPYTSIYGHAGHTEFLASSPSRNLNMRIECKWQQSSGSVDEKFPYLLENCKIMPEPQILILVDGGGCKPGAEQWLRQAASSVTHKQITVMNVTEFIRWANTL